jgi:hypothetical protein
MRIESFVSQSGRMPLYPQYPILNYLVDFGDPWLPVGLHHGGLLGGDRLGDLQDTPHAASVLAALPRRRVA